MACLLVAAAGAASSPEEIRECLTANVPRGSVSLALRMSSRDRAGGEYAHEARLYWKPSADGLSRTLLCMASPPTVYRLGYLILDHRTGRNAWAYLPDEARVLRIQARTAASRARIARTAIGYDDLRYLPMNLADIEPEATAESTFEGRSVAEVRLSLPPGEPSPYSRIVSLVDRESCVPLRNEFFEAGQLRKRVRVEPDAIAREGAIYVPRSLTVEDLKNGVTTEVEVSEIRVNAGLPDRMFTPAYLQRGRCPE